MLEIEAGDSYENICECCGNVTKNLTRFVYQDDNAFAVYYASFTVGHADKVLHGIIGLGEWGDDKQGPEARTAFALRIWLDGNNFQVGLVDAEESPWKDVTFLGRILERSEALKHEWISDVFHITDHMVAEDKEIVGYFSEADA